MQNNSLLWYNIRALQLRKKIIFYCTWIILTIPQEIQAQKKNKEKRKHEKKIEN